MQLDHLSNAGARISGVSHHSVDMRAIEPGGRFERFRYECLDCDWTLTVIEDRTTAGTPLDAHVQAEVHRRGVAYPR